MNAGALIIERALELGFSHCGIVPAGPLADAPRLAAWLDDGFAGDMGYMHEHRELRVDPSKLSDGARSVIAVAAPYAPPAGEDLVAAYAVGDDYHSAMRARLVQLEAFVRAETGASIVGRPAVDSAPVLERAVAVEAGLGWLGKSAMVLNTTHGSWTLLGELVVDVELTPDAAPHPDRCGRCTRCIDLCPTGAIVAPYRVDARRCISYLTIEARGPIPRSLRPAIGQRLFGCDVCQSVCPWSQRVSPTPLPELTRRASMRALDPARILTMSKPEFAATFAGSAIKRARRRGLARNAAVVLGNRRDTDDLGVLCDALARHDEPLVRGHAAWALGRLGHAEARRSLDRACRHEPDSYVCEELRAALEHGSP